MLLRCVLGDLNNWVSGWTDWNIALNTQGGPNHLSNCQRNNTDNGSNRAAYQLSLLPRLDRQRGWPAHSAVLFAAFVCFPDGPDAGCDAAVIVDTARGELEYTFMYFYLGHFSRFLPPGSKRIAHQMFSSDNEEVRGLEYVAFLVDREASEGGKGEDESTKSKSAPASSEKDIVLIVLNAQDRAGSFDIALDNRGAGLRFEEKHGSKVSVSIPPHSIQTIVFDARWI